MKEEVVCEFDIADDFVDCLLYVLAGDCLWGGNKC